MASKPLLPPLENDFARNGGRAPTLPDGTAPNMVGRILLLDTIKPFGGNPRTNFDEEALKRLADDIKERGVLQPVVVRPMKEPDGQYEYELIAGERRWRASYMAGRTAIPAIIRMVPSNEEALEIAIIENLIREEIDPIDFANGLFALSEMGYTQAEIGEKVHLPQSAVANYFRLRKLPEAVQKHIQEGTLTRAHGVALCSYSDYPDACEALAEIAILRRATSKDLEGKLRHYLAQELVEKKKDGQKIACFVHGEGVRSRLPAEMLKKTEYDYDLCLDAQAANEAEAKLQQDLDAEAARQVEEARQALAAAQSDRPWTTPVEDSENSSNGFIELKVPSPLEAPAVTSLVDAGKLDVSKLVHMKSLRWDQYEIVSREPPAGCTEECSCRCPAVNHSGTVITICTNPKRYKEFRAAQERVAKKEARGALKGRMSDVQNRIESGAPEVTLCAAVLLAYRTLRSAGQKRVQAIVHRRGLALDASLASSYDSGAEAKFRAQLMTLPVDTLLTLCVEASLQQEADNSLDYGTSASTPDIAWFLRHTPERTADLIVAQSAPTGQTQIPTDASEREQETFLGDGLNNLPPGQKSTWGQWKSNARIGWPRNEWHHIQPVPGNPAYEAYLSGMTGGQYRKQLDKELAQEGRP